VKVSLTRCALARKTCFGLKETWAKQWQREPTRDESRGLVTEFLKEELLAREAREMGLDQNDLVVHRRLAQKVEFLVQDAAQLSRKSNSPSIGDPRNAPGSSQPNVQGNFMGGIISRMFAALHSSRGRNLMLMAAPIDFLSKEKSPSENSDIDKRAVLARFLPAVWHFKPCPNPS